MYVYSVNLFSLWTIQYCIKSVLLLEVWLYYWLKSNWVISCAFVAKTENFFVWKNVRAADELGSFPCFWTRIYIVGFNIFYAPFRVIINIINP